jgi:hypothetical protein
MSRFPGRFDTHRNHLDAVVSGLGRTYVSEHPHVLSLNFCELQRCACHEN